MVKTKDNDAAMFTTGHTTWAGCLADVKNKDVGGVTGTTVP